MPTNKKIPLLISILIIFIAGILVYANSLKGDFVWDDTVLVSNNTYISDWSKLKNILTEDIGRGGFARFNFYRPVQMLTYMLDFSLWGLNPLGYHLTNILLHVLTAVLVFWLLMIIFGNNFVALTTSLIFVVCPLHTEAIAYISGRAEPLAAIFFLLSLIFYIKYATFSKVKYFIFTLLAYLFAVLSKENAFILPLIILLYSFTFKRKLKIGLFIFLLVQTLIIAAVKALFLSQHRGIGVGIVERLPGFFAALAGYLKILVLPFGLHMEYGNVLFTFQQPEVIIGLVIFLLLIVYAFKGTKARGIEFFAIFWFLICLLPFSGILHINAFMAEHWLYLPSIGFFLLASNLLLFVKQKFKPAAICIIVVILAYYSFITIKQNLYWRDNLTLYRYTIKYADNSLRVNNNLCSALVSAGKNKEAIDYCKKAIRIDPYFSAAYCNLGNAYKNLGTYALAEENYKHAIKISPKYEYAYNALGNLYVLVGRTDLARGAFEKALAINPLYSQARENLEEINN